MEGILPGLLSKAREASGEIVIRDDNLEGGLWSVTKAAKRIERHEVRGPEIGSHLFGTRDDIERYWGELTPAERREARRFDQAVLRELDWILKEEPFLGTPEGPPDDVDRRHW